MSARADQVEAERQWVRSQSMTERSIADLLAAVVQGDHTAFDVIVDRYVRLVWSVIRSFRLDGEAAKDVSQTVWTRLYVHCGKIRQPERLAGWLSTTAKNECVRVLREQRRQVPTDMSDEWALGSTPASDESIVADEMRRELLEAFADLSADCQQLLRLLTADDDLDYTAIAEIIDRPIGSIGPTRARCLDRLRRIMARRAPTGDEVMDSREE